MANIVAGTRSQPPTISTMVFVSQNCRLANSISQHHGVLACRIRRPYPILNPQKGHNLQLLADQRPSFSRKQAARYNTNKRAKTLTTRWRLRLEIAFRRIRYRSNNYGYKIRRLHDALPISIGISMANFVAGTRSQPPTISTMVFVSQNCRPANSIWQQQLG